MFEFDFTDEERREAYHRRAKALLDLLRQKIQAHGPIVDVEFATKPSDPVMQSHPADDEDGKADESELLKVGDVVRLKSGGPDMTVMKVKDQQEAGAPDIETLIDLTWFQGEGQVHCLSNIPHDALERLDEEAEPDRGFSNPYWKSSLSA